MDAFSFDLVLIFSKEKNSKPVILRFAILC